MILKATKRLSFISLIVLSIHCQADWVDSWYDAATYSGPDTFSTKNRHLITGGAFSVRSRIKTDYPVTISLPKVKAGCGGIDAFMGGFSFLDGDYLVDKAQRMMQASAYVAVDMALKTMSKEFSDTIKSAEQIVNALNSIQLNECRAAKPLVTAAINNDPEALKESLGEMVNAKQIRDATTRLWQESKENIDDNNGKSPVDLTQEVAGCPADIKHFFQGGSVIEHVASKTGLSEHADLMRGYFGDVIVSKKDNLFVAQPMQSCDENKNNTEGFLYGNSYERNATTGACTKSTGKSVLETITDRINSLSNKIVDDGVLSSEDRAFAGKGSNLPILKMLQIAYDGGNIDDTKQTIINITAATYAMRVTDSFYYEAYKILKRVSDEVTSNPTTDNTSNRCNMRVYSAPANQVRELLFTIREGRKELSLNVAVALEENSRFQDIVTEARRRLGDVNSNEAKKVRGL